MFFVKYSEKFIIQINGNKKRSYLNIGNESNEGPTRSKIKYSKLINDSKRTMYKATRLRKDQNNKNSELKEKITVIKPKETEKSSLRELNKIIFLKEETIQDLKPADEEFSYLSLSQKRNYLVSIIQNLLDTNLHIIKKESIR